MPSNLEPFKIKDGDETVFGPLSNYGSLKTQHSLNRDGVNKNYSYVGFGEGDTLQSSDLNEMQETHYVEKALLYSAIHVWGFSQGTAQSQPQQAGLLGWDGATPVSSGTNKVYASPIDESLITNNYEPLSITSKNGETTIQFNEGYFLLSSKNDSNSDHGFMYHVYLNFNSDSQKFKTVAPRRDNGITYVGLNFEQKEILPQTRFVGGIDTDETLMNEKLKSIDDRVTVAKRIQFNFTEAVNVFGSSTSDATNFAPVLYIDHLNRQVRYLNNSFITNIF